jgi:hypothetical protein
MQVVDDRFDLRDGTLDQPSPSGIRVDVSGGGLVGAVTEGSDCDRRQPVLVTMSPLVEIS